MTKLGVPCVCVFLISRLVVLATLCGDPLVVSDRVCCRVLAKRLRLPLESLTARPSDTGCGAYGS